MQLTKTIFLDSVSFIEKKRVENRLWRKSALCGDFVWRKKIIATSLRLPVRAGNDGSVDCDDGATAQCCGPTTAVGHGDDDHGPLTVTTAGRRQ